METIKSYTDLSQSKTLSKILSPESADMHFVNDKHAGCVPYLEMTDGSNPWLKGTNISPCWSLSALLGVLPNYQLQTQDDGIGILCSCNGKFNIVTANNPVDACVAMIVKLHEQKLL